MSTVSEYAAIDKSQWGEGPWQQEPDRLEWRQHGFPCLIVRNRMGFWCGYVAVGQEHPCYGQGYRNVNVDVHGDLTYAGRCAGHICHVPQSGESEDVWWLGFDCGHAFDLEPMSEMLLRNSGFQRELPTQDIYRDMHYVTAETNSLALQLKEMPPCPPH
jgi:hypothetical protein